MANRLGDLEYEGVGLDAGLKQKLVMGETLPPLQFLP